MKRLAPAFLIAAAITLASCTTGPAPIADKLDHAVDCNKSQILSQLPRIGITVMTDLLSQNYEAALMDLARELGGQEGQDIVVCAVAASGGTAKARLNDGTTDEQPNSATIAKNADAFLKGHGVVFVSAPPTSQGVSMPTDKERIAKAWERINAASHAMQTGVAYEMTQPGKEAAVDPKHLRVGVNMAMVGNSALATLLVDKGLITEPEYFEALALETEKEQARYQERMPAGVTLV